MKLTEVEMKTTIPPMTETMIIPPPIIPMNSHASCNKKEKKEINNDNYLLSSKKDS